MLTISESKTIMYNSQMEFAERHTELVLKALEKGALTRDEARAELKAQSEKTDVFAKLA